MRAKSSKIADRHSQVAPVAEAVLGEVLPGGGFSEDTAGVSPDLIRRCAEGEETALVAFFDRYSADIYNFPVKVFHLDRDSASDFYLYAFEKLRSGRRFASFQGKSSFKTWFYSVLRNLVIDWMRTIRSLPTINIGKTDQNGREYQTIEDEADMRQLLDQDLDQEISEKLHAALRAIKPETRIIFKLSFFYYVTLENDELDFIAQRCGLTRPVLVRRLLEMRDELARKNLETIRSEDKITQLYQNILALRLRKKRIEEQLEREGLLSRADGWDSQGRLNMLEKIEHSLRKKQLQREKLLEKKEKGHFTIRMPYRWIAELLRIPEGSLSVQLLRAIEKIRAILEENWRTG